MAIPVEKRLKIIVSKISFRKLKFNKCESDFKK